MNESVREAAKRFKDLGATVETVSIPMHLMGPAIWTPIGTEGMTQTMMYGDGYGLSRADLYSTTLMDFHRGWRRQADSLSETTKLFLLLGTYINNNFGPRYYGKALNISRRLTAAYDKALQGLRPAAAADDADEGDAAAAGRRASREDYVARALEMISNTAPFDITHHPAMSLPCGMVDGLPVGLMLVGRHVRGIHHLSRRACLRADRRLEEDVSGGRSAQVGWTKRAWLTRSSRRSRS